MKKILLLVTIIGYMATGCHENKKQENAVSDSSKDSGKAVTQPINWANYKPTDPEIVMQMAAHYIQIVQKNPAIGFQQINMDGDLLEALLVSTEGLKLVAAADLKTDSITIFLQFWQGGTFTYYDIYEIFNSTQKGMRGKQPLCPPPDGCDLPLVRSANPALMTEGKAGEMANHYNELVKADPKIAIQQITMDGLLLELLLYKTEGFKLIAAADLGTDSTTVIMQFWKQGEFTYYDIRDIFNSGMKGMRGQAPLCPPPDGCDLPVPLGNKMKK